MRINVDIPEDLIEEAMQIGGFRTRRATITAALEEFIRRRDRQKALHDLWGIGWHGNPEDLFPDSDSGETS